MLIADVPAVFAGDKLAAKIPMKLGTQPSPPACSLCWA
jgi:putative Ca2+/H+ antiporter (TMEM165/GDT1 family)